jgi:UDP-N-acetylmuramoyl-L-alanyl-D-glutamate--2,6-diaminopimelate ligase
MAENIHYVSEPDFVGVEFDIRGAHEIPVRVSIPGKFNVYNALCAAAVCIWAGVPEAMVQHALEHISIDGRMEIVYTSEKCCVIVDYAHNAVSMESLLETLREYHPKRLVCVFGCGGNRSKDRRYSMGEIAGKMADFSIITADNSRFEKVEDIIADIVGSMKKTGGSFIEIPDRREAIAYSIHHAQDGDMIAIIGKGHENYQEIQGVRYHFVDREVVEEVVKELEGK